MNYIVLDLEWNQCPYGKEQENKELPFEIIEIGAVKMNSKKECIGEFSRLIRPVVYKELNSYTRNILSLTMKDLKRGAGFVQIVTEFLQWCGEDYIFCTWGSTDLVELQRNMKFYGLPPLSQGPLKYYDVQKVFSIMYEEDVKARKSLEYAVDYLHILKNAAFHRAYEDAMYTMRIMQHMSYSDMERYYSIDTFQRPKDKKSEVYAVFEKYSKYISREFSSKEDAMADREVTSTRCYLCGKTARKKIRWFSGNTKMYFCQAYCENHGFLKGKIRMKKTEDGKFYVIKTLKLVSEEEASIIKKKQEEVRKKRREKRRHQTP